jgi:hypothetical protein
MSTVDFVQMYYPIAAPYIVIALGIALCVCIHMYRFNR